MGLRETLKAAATEANRALSIPMINAKYKLKRGLLFFFKPKDAEKMADQVMGALYGSDGAVTNMFLLGMDPANPESYKDFIFTRDDIVTMYNDMSRLGAELFKTNIKSGPFELPKITTTAFTKGQFAKYRHVLSLRTNAKMHGWGVGPWHRHP